MAQLMRASYKRVFDLPASKLDMLRSLLKTGRMLLLRKQALGFPVAAQVLHVPQAGLDKLKVHPNTSIRIASIYMVLVHQSHTLNTRSVRGGRRMCLGEGWGM